MSNYWFLLVVLGAAIGAAICYVAMSRRVRDADERASNKGDALSRKGADYNALHDKHLAVSRQASEFRERAARTAMEAVELIRLIQRDAGPRDNRLSIAQLLAVGIALAGFSDNAEYEREKAEIEKWAVELTSADMARMVAELSQGIGCEEIAAVHLARKSASRMPVVSAVAAPQPHGNHSNARTPIPPISGPL